MAKEGFKFNEDAPPPKKKEGGTGEGSGGTHREGQSADVRRSQKLDMHSSGKSWLLLTGCLVLYVIYLLFGALVFSAIERPMEEKLLRDLEALKQEFLNQSCASAASLDQLLVQVLAASRSGVSVLTNTSGPSNWDLTSSMFFANSLVTTVGEFLHVALGAVRVTVREVLQHRDAQGGDLFFSFSFFFYICTFTEMMKQKLEGTFNFLF